MTVLVISRNWLCYSEYLIEKKIPIWGSLGFRFARLIDTNVICCVEHMSLLSLACALYCEPFLQSDLHLSIANPEVPLNISYMWLCRAEIICKVMNVFHRNNNNILLLINWRSRWYRQRHICTIFLAIWVSPVVFQVLNKLTAYSDIVGHSVVIFSLSDTMCGCFLQSGFA